MIPSDLDIHRTAKIIIDQYGKEAVLEAMRRVERYREKNNENGMRVWNRVADAITWMQMPEHLTGETVH